MCSKKGGSLTTRYLVTKASIIYNTYAPLAPASMAWWSVSMRVKRQVPGSNPHQRYLLLVGFFLFNCLFIRLFLCLFVCLFACLLVCLFFPIVDTLCQLAICFYKTISYYFSTYFCEAEHGRRLPQKHLGARVRRLQLPEDEDTALHAQHDGMSWRHQETVELPPDVPL